MEATDRRCAHPARARAPAPTEAQRRTLGCCLPEAPRNAALHNLCGALQQVGVGSALRARFSNPLLCSSERCSEHSGTSAKFSSFLLPSHNARTAPPFPHSQGPFCDECSTFPLPPLCPARELNPAATPLNTSLAILLPPPLFFKTNTSRTFHSNKSITERNLSLPC